MEMLGAKDAAAIGLTRHTLAFEEGEDVFYNYLGAPSAVDDRIGFLSVANHSKYAKSARLSMRAAFAYALASQLAWQLGGLDYHEAVVGCPMDFTVDHKDLVLGLRTGRFCPDCERSLKKRGKIDLLEALRVLLQYGR